MPGFPDSLGHDPDAVIQDADIETAAWEAKAAETPENPRNLPCPTCGSPGRLTPADRQLGYQCDSCAAEAERGT